MARPSSVWPKPFPGSARISDKTGHAVRDASPRTQYNAAGTALRTPPMSLSITVPDTATEADARAILASDAVVGGSLALMRIAEGAWGPIEADAIIAVSRAAVERFRVGDSIDHIELLIMMAKISDELVRKFFTDAATKSQKASEYRKSGHDAKADALMRDADMLVRWAREAATVVNLAVSRAHKVRKGTGGGRFWNATPTGAKSNKRARPDIDGE